MRSSKKLPSGLLAMPRMSTISTQMPTAAETKFCTARPAIWLKDDSVVSPP